MSFPTTVLNLTVELALGADLTANPSTWAWTDVTAYVYVRDEIRATHGGYDGSTQIPPSTLSFTANNRDGRWCEYNPNGAWFGQLSQGTPVRVKVDEGSASVRMTGFIVSLPPRWDLSENDGHVPVTAAGVTRRLQRGSTSVKSSLTTAFSGGAYGAALTAAPLAYWPCEDESGATSLAEFNGGSPMTMTGTTVTPASDGPDGSKSLPELTSVGGVFATVKTYTNTNSWSVGMVFNIPTALASAATILRWHTGGSPAMWQVVITPGSPDTITLEGYDASGSSLFTDSMSFEVNTVSEPYAYWLALTVSGTQNGSNVDYEVALYLESSAATNSGSTAGTVGVVKDIGIPATARLDGTHIGHFAVWDSVVNTTNILSYIAAAIDGHAGESAHTRLTRLGSESGVEVEVDSTGTGTMGPQPVATFLTAARECEAVNNGRLFDNRDPTAFDALMRVIWSGDMMNQTAALALNHDSGHLAPPFEPTSDDQQLRNDWTARRSGGSSARVFAESGKLTPALVGTYDDSVTVNVETDGDLVHQAGWRLNVTTVEGLRFPRISLDFARNPSLIASWINCEIGSRVTVSNPPSGMPPDDVDTIIEGWTETFGPFEWRVDLNCAPYKPYNVLTLASTANDTDSGRLSGDPDAAIRAAITSSDLSMTVDPNFYRWTTRLAWDAFGRTEANGWGTADSGGAWSTSGGAASDYSVSSGGGKVSHGSVNVLRGTVLAAAVDCRLVVDVSLPVASASGATITRRIGARYTDSSNFYYARLDLTTGGAVNLQIIKVVASVGTTLASSLTVGTGHSANDVWRVVFEVEGTSLRAKAWKFGDTEPTIWQREATDSDLTAGSSVFLASRLESGNTDTLPVVVTWWDAGVSEVGDDPDDFPLNVRLGGEVVTVTGVATTAGTYVAAGAASHADNAAVTPAMYAGAAANDLICVLAAIRSSGTGTLTTPTDYTRLPVFASTDNVQLFAKVHDGSESDPTVTPSGGSAGDTVSAFTFGLRGTPCTLDDLTDIVVDSDVWLNASAQNIAYGGIYPKQYEGCIVLLLAWKQDDYTSIAVPSGFTEDLEASTTTGSDQSLYLAHQIQTTPAVVDEGSLVVTGGASAISRSAVVAIAAGYQTFTLSARAVNGTTKAQTAATKIEVEDALILAL